MESYKFYRIFLNLTPRGGEVVSRWAQFSIQLRERSEIHFIETEQRQRKAASAVFKEAWHLIEERAACLETFMRKSVKFGETSKCGNPEPSLIIEEGVET